MRIILDLKNRTLSYIINGTDYGVVLDEKHVEFEILNNDYYRFAVKLNKVITVKMM